MARAVRERRRRAEVGLAFRRQRPLRRRLRRAADDAAAAARAAEPGAPLTVNGQSWTVGSVVAAKLIAAEGELPKRPNLEHGFVVADLRSSRGEVGTIDYTDPARPAWSIGNSVVLSGLALTGLREDSEKTLAGRTLQCPSCGAALAVKLATTQSIVCTQCKSVIDLTSQQQGDVGGALAHYAQSHGGEPQIPLGSLGTLALGSAEPLSWQVVGYVERCEVPRTGRRDEQTFWREYLLYHRSVGFAFLVDAEDGWSWSAPITGAPQSFGDSVKHEGVLYRKLYDYVGKVTYVLGEFYWRLARDERTANTDYVGTGAAATKRLNREETEGEGTREVVWSAGETLSADTVLNAFRLAPDKRAALQRDSLPTTFKGSLLGKIFFWMFIVAIVLMLFRCGSGGGVGDCSETRNTFGAASQEYQNCLNSQRSGSGYRSGGGSFGGFSSGGGHK